ncbi:MAG TPA: tRNA lysidine(34) synthetase TilS [Cytophagales bacterium]|nr:tRNA lysidine(34) synthetase TilS [Cytophagales bacterium]
MRHDFAKFIKDNQLFKKHDKLLVATSGGADSVVLCHLLKELNINFIIAHCNFKLRGQESDEDELFVRALGKKLTIKVLVKEFDTLKEAESNKVSIQMVARELRYGWFNDLLKEEKCTYLATGHHKSDNLETILLNLTRGTGLAGLHGIKPKSNKIVRPLLFASKETIIQFLNENNIQYREDSSNASNKYYRNAIRHQVIPELKKINPNIESTITTFIEKITSIEEILNKEVEEFKAKRITVRQKDIYIDINGLDTEAGTLIKLYKTLEPYDFSFDQCKSLISVLEKQSGKVFKTQQFKAVKDRHKIIISPIISSQEVNFLIDESTVDIKTDNLILSLRKINADQFSLKKDKNYAQLDNDKLKYPLSLRYWEKGDFFYPLGMQKKKKLSDFFIDQKVPLSEKEKTLVLVSDQQIVWIIGERIDDRYKITTDTKEILEVESVSAK